MISKENRGLLITDQTRYNRDGSSMFDYTDKEETLFSQVERRPNTSVLQSNNWRDPTDFLVRYRSLRMLGNARSFDINGQHAYAFASRVEQEYLGSGNYPERNTIRSDGYDSFYPIDLPNSVTSLRFADRSDMEAYAVASSYNMLKNSPVHMGLLLGTLPETLRFIAEQYRVFSRALRFARKGQFGKAAHILVSSQHRGPDVEKYLRRKARKVKDISKNDSNNLDVLSAKWLEVQFGWLPLLADIQGLIELAPTVSGMLDMPRVTGRNVQIRNFVDTREGNKSSTPYGPILDWTINTKSESVTICRTDWSVGDPSLYLASIVGILNPLEVAWDKVPFSFVVDWFLPVNTWISAMTADAGLTYLGGSITSTSTAEGLLVARPAVKSTSTYRYSQYGFPTMIYSDKNSQRRKFVSSPSLGLPPLRYPKTLWHAITGAALLYQTKDLVTGNLRKRS